MKTIRLTLCAAAMLTSIGGWAIAQHAQHPQPAPPKVAFAEQVREIPFELFRGNRIVVQATLNGNATEFLLDTGASITTVDRAYARSIGLPEGRKVPGRGAGGAVDAEVVSGVTVEVGGVRFTDMTVAVMDLQPVARGIGRPLNVVLGREFFNKSVVSIDWAAGRLHVSSPESFAAKPGATALQLERKGPFNTIPVSVAGGQPINALLDVGNGGALFLPKTYWGNRPEIAGLRYAESRAGGVGGVHPARVVVIPRVTIAGRTFTNVPATLGEGGNDHDPTQMANVGIGLLKQFHVDLDLGRDRIYLTPRANAPAFERDRAGARVELLGDRLRVSFVSPQGPAAAAGLKPGDEIVAVDGRPVTPNYYKDRDWSRAPAGTKVALKRVDGSEVRVTLADYY